jgi:acyl-CoA thioesterase-1
MPIFFRAARLMAVGLATALALAGCNGNADTADAVPANDAVQGGEGGAPPIPIMGEEVRILAFGDSLFAGYGFAEPAQDSYPARLEGALRARGINARIVNAGVSGDTSAAGLKRLEFVLDAQAGKPDLFILELGGNDLLRGLSPDQTRANFRAMLEELAAREIPVLIMGMRAPPNYGPEFQAAFDGLYRDLADEYGAQLVPFWLEEIYRQPQLFQDDRIHPTEEGVEALVGATVDDVAEALAPDGGAAASAAQAS